MSVECWTTGLAHVAFAPRAAELAEAEGWDGMLVVDSQNLSGDPFVGLALAARETSELGLGTGVSNPATRHPAAAAAAIASVHTASGGRAVLGVGRGDSALAHLGLAPASLAELEAWILVVREYLRGEAVSFEALKPWARPGARPVDALGLATAPDDSRLHWLDRSLPPVPVEVAATGPKALSLAARSSDRVLLAVGADPSRVAWAAETARGAGRAPLGAFVNVVAHPDLPTARTLVAGGLSTFARFSAMDGNVPTPADDATLEVLHRVHDVYDMGRHTRAVSPQAASLTPAFIDQFAIVGPPAHCVSRLEKLAAIGLQRLIIVGPSRGADREEAQRASELFAKEVLPAAQAL